jgi:hypothetical protein
MSDPGRQQSFLVGLIGADMQASHAPALHEREADEQPELRFPSFEE